MPQAAILAAGCPAGRARPQSASAVLGRVAATLGSDVSTICSRAIILLIFISTSLRIATGLVRRGYALRYLQDRRIPMEVEFLLEKDGKVVPLEVKASNASTASLN